MMVIEYDPSTDVPGGILGAYFNFTPETQVAPASGALQARAQNVNARFAAKAAQMEECELHSVVASEKSALVINAIPVAKSFEKTNVAIVQ